MDSLQLSQARYNELKNGWMNDLGRAGAHSVLLSF